MHFVGGNSGLGMGWRIQFWLSDSRPIHSEHELPFVKNGSDEYVHCIPNPKHTPKYTKAKVPKINTQLSS